MNAEDLIDGAAGSVGMPRVLTDLADGRLDGEETDALVVWLRASEDQSPAWVVNRAVRIGQQAEAGRRARPRLWRRAAAALVFDSRLQPRAAGARAVGAEQLRLMYQAGAAEIDLEVTNSSTEGRLRLLGQINDGEVDLAGTCVVAEGPARRIESGVDELGQFVLDGLLAGVHRIEIGLARELIEISEVQI